MCQPALGMPLVVAGSHSLSILQFHNFLASPGRSRSLCPLGQHDLMGLWACTCHLGGKSNQEAVPDLEFSLHTRIQNWPELTGAAWPQLRAGTESQRWVGSALWNSASLVLASGTCPLPFCKCTVKPSVVINGQCVDCFNPACQLCAAAAPPFYCQACWDLCAWAGAWGIWLFSCEDRICKLKEEC